MKITIQDINRLLNVDGATVKAIDVVDDRSKEHLVKTLTWIIVKLEELALEELVK